MQLRILDSTFSVVKLSPADPVPSWALNGELCSVTRTADELSIVVPTACLPPDAAFADVEHGFRCIKIEEGVLDFSLTGILASLAVPLAGAEISIFAIATYNTDYILVKNHSLAKARAVLEQAGHTFIR
jgi:hypothetical protein